jgi:hypothetical protein
VGCERVALTQPRPGINAPSNFSYDMLSFEPLQSSVNHNIVHTIIVSFRQQQLAILLRAINIGRRLRRSGISPNINGGRNIVGFQDPVNDRYVDARDFIDGDITRFVLL